jgi:threonine/homoserine/homoserine lactone efflux protein
MLVFLSAGIVTGLSAGVSPGPLFALVVSQAVRHGAREGIKVATVPLLTDLPLILASTFLLTRLGDFRPALGAVSLAGALFLLHLAVESFRSPPPDAALAGDSPDSVRKGVLVNFLNPHPYLFWVTVGTPTMLRGWGESPGSGAAFLAGFFACLVGSKIVLALLAARSRRFLAGRGYRLLMRLLGVLLAFYAVVLLRDGAAMLGLM